MKRLPTLPPPYYALRTGDSPLVKRLRKRDHRWWADSDNEEYEPQPLDDRARIMGRVVWWAHTDPSLPR